MSSVNKATQKSPRNLDFQTSPDLAEETLIGGKTVIGTLIRSSNERVEAQKKKLIHALENSLHSGFQYTSDSSSPAFTADLMRSLNGIMLSDGKVVHADANGVIRIRAGLNIASLLRSGIGTNEIVEIIKRGIDGAKGKASQYRIMISDNLNSDEISSVQKILVRLANEKSISNVKLTGSNVPPSFLTSTFDGLPLKEGVLRITSSGKFETAKRFAVGMFGNSDLDFKEDLKKIRRAITMASAHTLQVWVRPNRMSAPQVNALRVLQVRARNIGKMFEIHTTKAESASMAGFVQARNVVSLKEFPESLNPYERAQQVLKEQEGIKKLAGKLDNGLSQAAHLRYLVPQTSVAVWIQREELDPEQKTLIRELADKSENFNIIASPTIREIHSDLFTAGKKGVAWIKKIFSWPGRTQHKY